MKKILFISLAVALALSIGLIGCEGEGEGEGEEPPEVPTGLNCTAVSISQIDLSWDASTDADDYYIYRCEGSSCTPATKVYTASNTSWSDTGLDSSTTYCYSVSAHNDKGESDHSTTVCARTYDNPQEAWNKVFTCGPLNEVAFSGQQTSDGGYIVSGYATGCGAGLDDVWLIKTDSAGNQEWAQTLGGSSHDYGYSVQQTLDGGYIIAGCTYSYGAGGADVYLVKTDASGNMAWNTTFGGSGEDYGQSVQQTADGEYIITGFTASYGAGGIDVWLIKADASGNKIWDKTFGGTEEDKGREVVQNSDGGYTITGHTYSYGAGQADVWLIKTDPAGNKVWDKTFGGTADDRGESGQPTSDGGYIITGGTNSYGFVGTGDFWLIKTDSSGNLEWDTTFGDFWVDDGKSVEQTSDGGYIIVGNTLSFGAGGYDVWLIKTDSSGNQVWDMLFGSGVNDFGAEVHQTSDGGYIIAGDTNFHDLWLIKVTV